MTRKQWWGLICGLGLVSYLPAACGIGRSASLEAADAPALTSAKAERTAPASTTRSQTDAREEEGSPRQQSSEGSYLPPMDEVDQMIGAVINMNGYLCARPIAVREAGTGLYGVRCITRRDGTGISDYLVNSRTNEVEPI